MRRLSSAMIFNSRAFRDEREADWLRLEQLVSRAEGGSVRSLSDDELLALPVLYRAALSSLSVARETSLDAELIGYLEQLCTRAYFFVYGVHTTFGARMSSFFRRDWPAAVQGLWRETLISLALMLAGALAAFMLVSSDPGWYSAIIPEGLAAGRDPSATTEFLREGLYESQGTDALSVFAASLFTHNAQVSIFAFALGFAFGVPSSLLIAYNGTMIGAFFALYADHGLTYELGGWLMIHGSTELFAIVLAGAAGLHIGTRVAFPGAQGRLMWAVAAARCTR
ncbi:MAG: stage II sporulation protein M, partial [Sphingomonadaceae bacterium]|nr:stage II sporulation protein M [Sphingomonadaceae bacterium]